MDINSSQVPSRVVIPEGGEKVTLSNGVLHISNQPIVCFIEGDGIGSDISPVMRKVVDKAVEHVYCGEKRIFWMELYAGEKATRLYGENHWLPEETLTLLDDYHIGIKGPLTTPVGGGFRSLNVTMRQKLDLYVCLRPVRYFEGSPSPLRNPGMTDMVIFRENAEGSYVGIEWAPGSADAGKLLHYICHDLGMPLTKFTNNCGVGVKLASEEGSKRLIRKAFEYAITNRRRYVTLVHKGNIMKYTEGAFLKWGYELAREEFDAKPMDDGSPWLVIKHPEKGYDIIVNDMIADAFFQNSLLYPESFDVIATMNLNGDYISDALAAQVGGIGIAPGANLGDRTALFEATHGTAPSCAGLNKANPSSLILSAALMLRHMGWHQPAVAIENALQEAIKDKKVTEDFASHMEDAHVLSCSDFGDYLIERLLSD